MATTALAAVHRVDSEGSARNRNYAFSLAFLASALGLFSIAASHLLLGLAVAALLISRSPLRLPAAAIPLGGFLAWTLVSLAFSDDPAGGLPQVKKLYVFLFLLVVYSAFRGASDSRRLMEAWFICGSAAALWSGRQFLQKWSAANAAGEDFLQAYQADRITGFFSHWMTYSQAGLLVLLALAAYLMFSEFLGRPGRWVWFGCAALLGISIEILSYTRSVWLASAVAGGYLVWNWKRRWLLAAPLVLVAALLAAPASLLERASSIFDFEANSARLIMWRTGAAMIAEHPVVGVGPERVGPRFDEFRPDEVSELPPAYYGHLHNIYVHYGAERGLPAVVFLLWFFGRVLFDHGRALRRLRAGRSDRRFLLHAVIAGTLAVMTVGCFDVTLGDSEVLAIYLVLVAIGYRAVDAVEAVAS